MALTSPSAGPTAPRRAPIPDLAGPLSRVPAIAVILLAGLALRLLIAYVWFPGEGLSSDLRLYRVWAQTLADFGPGGFYGNAGFADYPPGYLWVLWGMGALANVIAGVTGAAPADVINSMVKLPAIAADIGVASLLYWTASRWQNRRAGLLAAGLFLFVPVTWYDSALWGQVDAIGAVLLLGGIVLLVEGWSEPAVAVGVLATVTKPQYAIGLVIIGAVLIRRHLLARGTGPIPSPLGWATRLDRRLGAWFTTQQGAWRLVSCAGVAAIVGIASILPFDLPSQASPELGSIPIVGSVAGLLSVVGSAAAYYAVLTVNAFNAWAFIGPNPLTGAISSPDLTWTPDSIQVLGPFTAAAMGAILLVFITLVVALTLCLSDDRKAIVLGFTVLAIAFFAVPTRVHERYLFPVFGVGALLAVMSPRWVLWYVALALTNAANLHAVMTLPFVGYATPGLRGLPLGDFLREPFVVGVIADLHTVLFIIVIAVFIRQESWPALRRFLAPEPVEPGVATGRALAPDVLRVWLAASLDRYQRSRSKARAATPPVLERIEPPEAGSRLDRRDLGVFVLLVVVVLGSRIYRLDMPRTMYFDERWHATTAAEFLQDWRYGIPHDISEWTHPHLAKYLMAAGLVAFGGDNESGAGLLDTPVTDATFEPSYVDPTAPTGIAGNRLVLATGTGVRVAERGDLSATSGFTLPGAISVATDADAHWTVIGTSEGGVWVVNSADLAQFAQLGAVPRPRQVATLVGPVVRLWPVGGGRVAALTGAGRLSMIDVSNGGVLSALNVPGVGAVLPFGPADRHLAALALPTGLAVVDTTSMTQTQVLGVSGGALGLAYVDGSDQLRRERDLLEQPTIYLATGASALATFTIAVDGTLAQTASVVMPGPVTDIKWDRATNLVHVLGTAPDGTPTIYVVEPHTNAVFADSKLDFAPRAWVLDAQPNDPGTDRERAIAFAPTGLYATVDVGSHAFAWRVPGVLLGALTVGLLYLLARILFARRRVGLLFAGLLVMDGLVFQQSRIAMNDVYVGFFVVAGFTLLAYFMQSVAAGRRALLELLLIPPLLGILFGLGLASKWVAAYAVGGAILIILFRSRLGRRLALAGMLALTAALGFLAVADDPPNLVFLLLMLGLTALLGAGIVRGEGRPAPVDPGPAWFQPRWRAGLPLAWVLGSLIVIPVIVYVASYIPWALTTAGGPQLFAGWPPGHTGQTFLDLQAQMYQYHDEFRFPHGAGSPWWAWPFDLKPLWGYLETFADGTQATVLGAGNPFLFWMSVPAFGFAAWQAWRRRNWALGFVAIAFLALWLPWARVDRVAFDYHYSVTVLFAFLLLAWFLAELIDRPTGQLTWFARRAFGVVLFLPTILWLFKGPLCTVAGADRVNPTTAVCAAPITDVAAPVLAWTVFATAVFVLGVLGASPRRMVGVMLGLAVATSIALYPALSAVRLPNGLPWVYQGLLPSWDSSFQFWSNTAEAVAHPLLGVGSLAVLIVAAILTAVAMLLARRWGSDAAPRGSWPRGSLGPRFVSRGGGGPAASPVTLQSRPTASPEPQLAPDVGGAVALLRTRMQDMLALQRHATALLPRVRFAALPRVRVVARPPLGIVALQRVFLDLGLRGTIVTLAAISLVAAIIVDRFSGLGGPWLWNFDMPLANYPFASYFHEALAKGTLPLWNDRVGMGFPLYAEGQIGALYPPNWLIYQLPPLVALDVARILHLVLAGVGGGLIVLRMTGSRAGAVTAAIVAVLCGGIASKLEWTQVVTVYGWMPWVLLPLLWRRPSPGRGLVVLAGVFWGIQALGGHPPYWVLTGIAAAVIIIAQSPSARGLGRIVLFGLVGVGVGAVQLIPTFVITTISWRAQGVGAGSLFEYSATPFDFLAVAFGNAFVPAQGAAWDLYKSWYPGGSVWATLEVYAYVGLPALALSAIGLVRGRARPVLIVAIVSVAIPLVGVLQPGIWAAIPGLNGLRHPIRAYLLLDLALAIGAGIGVARMGRGAILRPAAVIVGVALGGYLLISVVAAGFPGVFDGLVRLFWPYVPVGQEGVIRDLAVTALIRPWPIVLEVTAAGALLYLLRRRTRAPAVRVAAVVLVAVPLALLTPAVNQSLPSTAFTIEGTTLARTVASLQPRQVLTLDEPFYGGFPVALADVASRDPHVYTSQFGLSLRLQASEDLIANLRSAGPTSPLALAAGVDTVVAFNESCGGRQVATDATYHATICRNDGALRPPYWVPASVVLATQGGGALPITPVDAVVDPGRVLKNNAAATVASWDEGSATIQVNAPADGYVFIDRSWWPGWQVTVDGVGVAPMRAWGGQLVPVSDGAHTIEQHLTPWDAGLGALVSFGSLLVIAMWAWRRPQDSQGLAWDRHSHLAAPTRTGKE
jgi:hypothetical protein